MLTTIILIAAIFLISAIPLNIAARLMGGRTHLLMTALVNVVAGVAVALVQVYVHTFGGIVSFVLLLFIYKIFFRIGWIRALLVWGIQLVLTAMLIGIAALFGFTIMLF